MALLVAQDAHVFVIRVVEGGGGRIDVLASVLQKGGNALRQTRVYLFAYMHRLYSCVVFQPWQRA